MIKDILYTVWSISSVLILIILLSFVIVEYAIRSERRKEDKRNYIMVRSVKYYKKKAHRKSGQN